MDSVEREGSDPAGRLHAIAIAGGAGTRLWPLSRRTRPKPLLGLGDGTTLLAATFERVRSLVPPQRWWMVVGAEHAAPCQEAVAPIDRRHVLIEPTGRNTLPAIALAAVHLRHQDPDGVLVVLPADHHVADEGAFCAALGEAAAAARGGAIATLGITPDRPETGYGYIEVGDADPRGGRRAASFREKPDRATAADYVASGRFAWNAGIFVVRLDVLLDEIRRQRPEHAAAFERVDAALEEPSYPAALAQAYDEIPSISIDYGVMEGARDVVVVPVDCGWSDLGDVTALASLLAPQDDAGNRLKDAVVTVDTRRCTVLRGAEDEERPHLVALLGLEDVVVVHTPDATLVMPADRAQDVRAVVDKLGASGWEAWR